MRRLLALLISVPLFGADLETRLHQLLEAPLLGLEKFESPSPPTIQTARLGRLLFFDKRLSKDGTVACASCHDVKNAFSSATALSAGVGGALGNRKAPVILNRAFNATQFWDGRASSLEEQAIGPLVNPVEMANTPEKVVQTLTSISGYSPHFVRAFGTPEVTMGRVQRAIADFERTLMSGNSKYDKWVSDPASVLFSETETRGFFLFNDRECHICHKAPSFSDEEFHNTGVAFKVSLFADEGRFGFTKLLGIQKDQELGAFKTPTLRNLRSHGPYMHDGSIPTLEAVIDFYNNGGVKNPHLDPDIIRLGLQPEEKQALLAFLLTLEGEGFEETPPTQEELPL